MPDRMYVIGNSEFDVYLPFGLHAHPEGYLERKANDDVGLPDARRPGPLDPIKLDWKDTTGYPSSPAAFWNNHSRIQMRPQQFPVHAASQAFNLNPGFGATKYLAQQPFLPDALGQDVMGFQHSLNDFTTQRISDLSQSEGLSQSSSQYPNITGTPSTNFQCTTDGCNKIFTGKGAKIAYNRHINSHKRPYPCPESSCNRHTHGFSRKDNLKNHIDRLHPMTTQKPLEHHTTNRTTKLRQNHGFRKLDADSSLSLELLKAKVYRIESMARNLKKMCGSILSMIEDSDEDNRMADMSSEDEGEDVEE